MQIQDKISVYNDVYNGRISEKLAELGKTLKKRKPKKHVGFKIVLTATVIMLLMFSFAVLYLNRVFESKVFSSQPEFKSNIPEYSSSNSIFATFSPNVTVSVFDRGNEPYEVSSKAVSISKLFEENGVTLDDSCSVNYPLYTVVFDGMEIVIDSYTYEDYSVESAIPFTVVTNEFRTIPRGTRQVLVEGKDGILKTTYRKYFKNGELLEEKELSAVTTLPPVSEVCNLGVGGTIVGNDGKIYSYSYYMDVEATAYGACEGFGGRTSTGIQVREGIIAVDPTVIPYHTKCYVTGSGYDWGYVEAEDCGGAIIGNRIDIYMDGTIERINAFGRRQMRLYILD